MQILSKVEDIRELSQALRKEAGAVALVPTMGALHEGHLSLVRHGRQFAKAVIVSIFVNPTQFAANEDLSTYPRDPEGDLAKLRAEGVEAVFMPDASAMYPEGFATRVELDGPAKGLEADFRPTHFSGVATVVTKLLLQTMPDVAVFGEKDYQQLQVIRRAVKDLDIPVRILAAPTLRAEGGLALSSRNVYLSEEELKIAPELNKALRITAKALCGGKTPDEAEAEGLAHLIANGFKPDYLAVRNAVNLAKVESIKGQDLRILTAARLGRTRLIDNIAFEPKA